MKRTKFVVFILLAVWLAFPSPSEAQWLRASAPDGIRVLVASGPNLYAGVSTSFNGGVVLFSGDSGATWTPLNAAGWPKPPKRGVPKVNSVTSIEVNGPEIFVGTDDGVYVSRDGGASWAPLTGSVQNRMVYCLASAGTYRFAGGQAGAFISSDDGASWTISAAGLPKGAYVQHLVVLGSQVFAGTFYGVFVSKDNGLSWTEAGAGFPAKRSVTGLATTRTKIFASIDGAGIFRSDNLGTSWVPASQGLPALAVASCFAVLGPKIFAGFHEAGVFESADEGRSWTAVNAGWPPEKISPQCLAANDSQLTAYVFDGMINNFEVWRRPWTGTAAATAETAQTYYANGQRSYRDGDFASAVLLFGKAVERDPKLTDAWLQRAWSYHNAGGESNCDKALADLARVLELDPANKSVYFLRGEIYRRQGYFALDRKNAKAAEDLLAKALGDYRIALAADPDSPVILASIAHAQAAKGNLDSALAGYSSLLEKKPEDAEVIRWLSGLFGQYAQENRECDCGNYPRTWQLAGRFQAEHKNDGKAIRCFTRAIELGLADWSIYSDRSRAYERQGDLARAIADATEVLKRIDSEFSYSARGDLYAKTGEYDKAISDYTAAIKLEQKSLKALPTLYKLEYLIGFYGKRANAFMKKKSWDKAIDDYKFIDDHLTGGEGKAKANTALWEAYLNKGDAKNAEKYLQRAKDIEAGLKK